MQSTFVEKTVTRSSRSIANQITSLKGKSMPASSRPAQLYALAFAHSTFNADSNVVQRQIQSMKEPKEFGSGWIWWDTDDFVEGGSYATYSTSKEEYIGVRAHSILLGSYPPSEPKREIGPPKPAAASKIYGPTMPPPEERKSKEGKAQGSGETSRLDGMRLATRIWMNNHPQHPATPHLNGFAWGEALKKDIHGPSGHVTTKNGAHIFFKNGTVEDAAAPGQTNSSGGAVLYPSSERRW